MNLKRKEIGGCPPTIKKSWHIESFKEMVEKYIPYQTALAMADFLHGNDLKK